MRKPHKKPTKEQVRRYNKRYRDKNREILGKKNNEYRKRKRLEKRTFFERLEIKIRKILHLKKFCSKEARKNIGLALKGHPTSKETRRKIGLGNKGKKLSKKHKRFLRNLHLGIHRTKETREKISKGNWKGGTNGYFHKQARKLMNVTSQDLVVHHIDFNWRNNNLSNLKIMTATEHSSFHAKRKRKKRI